MNNDIATYSAPAAGPRTSRPASERDTISTVGPQELKRRAYSPPAKPATPTSAFPNVVRIKLFRVGVGSRGSAGPGPDPFAGAGAMFAVL